MFSYSKIVNTLKESIDSVVSVIVGGSSAEDEKAKFNDPDLFGYIKSKDWTTSGFNPLVPNGSSSSTSLYATYQPRLNVTRLRQTHIYQILNDHYSKEYAIKNPRIEAFGSPISAVEDVVKRIESNIVAIGLCKGEPIGTGLLIAPNLVLTARHCIEGIQPSNLAAITNFQEVDNGMDFGTQYKINGFVEEDIQLDYVILELNDSSPYFSPFEIDLSGNLSKESIFFHHPSGGPKKVSVHENVSSDYMLLAQSSYHDTEKGSSGGVYVNASAKVTAMHCLGRNNTQLVTYASFMSNIWEKSNVMRSIFSENGNYEGGNPRYTVRNNHLSITDFNYWRERSTRLSIIPDHPARFFSYHHIIPITDMEFLWMISKENSKLDSLLKSLSCDSNEVVDSHGRLTINAVGWMPWNLFVGPDNSCRINDPGESIETIRPATFHEELWRHIMLLNDGIQEAWKVRSLISGNLREIAKKHLPDRDYQATLGHELNVALMQQQKMNKETLQKLKREYKNIQFKISEILEKILTIVRVRHKNYIHNNMNDWLKDQNGKYRLITQSDREYTKVIQMQHKPCGYQTTAIQPASRSIGRRL